MNRTRVFCLALWLVSLSATAGEIVWPSLPTKGFISGRPATQNDVDAGNAVFVAQVGEVVIGKPLNIKIPQYAYFNDEGKKVPVIIVQAEEAQGTKMIGARYLTGNEAVGVATDFEFLGTTKPK